MAISRTSSAADPPVADPPVTAITFTPNGKQVLAGSQAGIRLYSWPSLKPGRRLNSELVNVHDLAFAPNGQRLIAGGGTPGEQGTAELYSWPAGKRLASMTHHDDAVYGLAWRRDSSGWVTAGLDRRLYVYDREQPEKPVRLSGHSRGVTAAGILPDSKTLLSAGRDNSLRVWSLPEGTVLRVFNNHTKPVHDLAPRPSTAEAALPVAVTVSADRTVRLWQPTIGRMVRFRRLEQAIPLCVRWTPDGSAIVTGCTDGSVRVIGSDTVELLQKTETRVGRVFCIDVHPNGRQAVAGGARLTLVEIVLQY